MNEKVHINNILQRAKKEAGVSTNKQLADLLGISENNFSNMKRRGTILTPLLEWAINRRVHLSWLVYGEEKEIQEVRQNMPILFEEIAQLQEWLSEMSKVEPERRSWFRMELLDKFPAFKGWLNEKKAEGDEGELFSRKVCE